MVPLYNQCQAYLRLCVSWMQGELTEPQLKERLWQLQSKLMSTDLQSSRWFRAVGVDYYNHMEVNSSLAFPWTEAEEICADLGDRACQDSTTRPKMLVELGKVAYTNPEYTKERIQESLKRVFDRDLEYLMKEDRIPDYAMDAYQSSLTFPIT